MSSVVCVEGGTMANKEKHRRERGIVVPATYYLVFHCAASGSARAGEAK